MVEHPFLWDIIPVVFGEFILCIGVVAYFYNRQRANLGQTTKDSFGGKIEDTFCNSVGDYFTGLNFERSYQSFRGIKWTAFLCFARFSFLIYFLAIGLIYQNVYFDGKLFFFFTVWNLELIFVYYLLATTCSFIGLYEEYKTTQQDEHSSLCSERHLLFSTENSNWTLFTVRLGYATQILFELAGSTALFVTIVDFVVLNPGFYFWNISMHFLTSLSFLIELLLNSIPVRWEHVLINLSWCFLYQLFIWPMVITGVVQQWPYDFLRMDKSTCFLWYTGLLIGNICFFYIWWGLSALKMKYLRPELNTEEEASLRYSLLPKTNLGIGNGNIETNQNREQNRKNTGMSLNNGL